MDSLVNRAYKFALKKHKGQKYGDKSFISHPAMVKEIVLFLFPLDYELQAAALLHDTIEETDATYEDLVSEFGEDVALLVREVTKSGYNTFPYLVSERGVILKFADRLSNLAHMDNWDMERRNKYILKSRFWKS